MDLGLFPTSTLRRSHILIDTLLPLSGTRPLSHVVVEHFSIQHLPRAGFTTGMRCGRASAYDIPEGLRDRDTNSQDVRKISYGTPFCVRISKVLLRDVGSRVRGKILDCCVTHIPHIYHHYVSHTHSNHPPPLPAADIATIDELLRLQRTSLHRYLSPV